jgi:3-carboxy-cis,cis-muconate cycloisomerase
MFDAIYARGAVATHFSDDAWVQAMVDVEAALTRTLVALGTIPREAGERALAATAQPGRVDVALLRRSVAENATPVVGLVTALREGLGDDASWIHLGATSQDIVDTALMRLVRRAFDPLLEDLDAAADACARLAEEHRATPMIARTLLQQALPTSFGLYAAAWLDGLDQARVHLVHVRDVELAVQMGGPVGGRDPRVADGVAAELGLAASTISWATTRVHTGLCASVLGTLAGVLATVARDVTLLAQTEIAEVREGRAGGSSAMAHKRNPVAAVSALACTRRVPGLVATMLSAMEQEHQRAAGAWQAEWGTLAELVTLTGSATAWVRDLVGSLEIDPARMEANLAVAATAGDPLPDGREALIDRALANHEEVRRSP